MGSNAIRIKEHFVVKRVQSKTAWHVVESELDSATCSRGAMQGNRWAWYVVESELDFATCGRSEMQGNRWGQCDLGPYVGV